MDGTAALAERFYASLDSEDVAPILELCATDVTVEYPAAGRIPYGGTWHGHDGMGSFLQAHDDAEEILVFEPADFVTDGDRVIVLGTFEGRAKDTDRTWSTDFVHVLTFTGDLLARWQAYFDTAAAIEAHA